MKAIQLTLGTYLREHGISAYRLAQAAKGRVSRGSVYALARGDTTRVDLATLGAVITTLEELTGQEVGPGDLLAAVTLPEVDPETEGWLGSDVSRLGEFEPYDFGDADPLTLGQAVRFTADGELQIGDKA